MAIDKGNRLETNQQLKPGEFLRSDNGLFELALQDFDGNLVLYYTGHGKRQPMWATMTVKEAGDAEISRYLTMQDDGNLVLYRNDQHATWASETGLGGHHITSAEMQDDGNLAVRVDGEVKWVSGTANARWMETSLADDRTLKNSCIPGSHDAGMYTSKILMDGIALAQSLNVYDQLRAGSRYFDLRPRYIEGKGYYLYHGPADGPKLEEVLDQVRQFFDEGSRETVILNFSHFKDWPNSPADDSAWNSLKKLMDALPDFLKPHDWRNGHTPPQPTYNPRDKDFLDFVRTRLQNHLLTGHQGVALATLPLAKLRGKVLVTLENHSMYTQVVTPFQYAGLFELTTEPAAKLQPGQHPELGLYDSYANTVWESRIVEDQTDKFRAFDATDERLFMVNWTLTPPDSAWSVLGPTVKDSNKRAHARLQHEFAQRSELFVPLPGKRVNILNLDYVQDANPVAICRYLNAQPV